MPTRLSDEELDYVNSGRGATTEMGGGWGMRLGAAVRSTGASLLGVGEAAGLDLGEARRRLQVGADADRALAARNTDAPRSFSEVDGLGSFGRYAAGLAVDTAPQIGATLATVPFTGGLGAAGRLAAAGAVNYPINLGQVLDAQRDQAGTARLGQAAALAVPYTALDVGLGVDSAIARRELVRSGIKGLDDMTGIKGVAARTGVAVGKGMTGEALGETGQAGLEQWGRMGVDASETFINPASTERFKEAAIGGATLGGLFGGAGGGWMRSRDYEPKGAPEPIAGEHDSFNLLGHSRTPNVLYAMPDGSTAWGSELTEAQRQSAVRASQPQPVDASPPPALPYDPSTIEGPVQRSGGPLTAFPDGRGTTPQDAENIAFNERLNGFPPPPVQPGGLGQSLDMFGGPARSAGDVQGPAPLPDFELEGQDPRMAGQGELDLQMPQPGPTAPTLPHGRQRGITGQLPYSSNTTSPKGQVLQGFVDSLADEGHMDDGSHVQASTLIAQGKFAAAKKIIDVAVAEKQAADTLMSKVQSIQQKEAERADTAAGRQPKPRRADPPVAPAAAVAPAPRPAAAPVEPAPVEPQAAAPVEPEAADFTDPREPETTEAALSVLEDESVIEAVENSKDDADYEAAMRELVQRWRGADSAAINAYMEENMGTSPAKRGFTAEVGRVNRQLHDESKQQRTAEVGARRGIRLGRESEGLKSNIDEETARGLSEALSPRQMARNGDIESDTQWRERPDAAPARGLSLDALTAIVDKLVARLPRKVGVTVLASGSELGAKAPPASVRAMGGVVDGRIYLFADNIDSALEAAQTLFHELFHMGLRSALPVGEYHARMRQLAAADETVRRYASEWLTGPDARERRSAGMPATELHSLAVEEALARIAETVGQTGSAWQRTMQAVADWLAGIARRLGLDDVAASLRAMQPSEVERFVLDTIGRAADTQARVEAAQVAAAPGAEDSTWRSKTEAPASPESRRLSERFEQTAAGKTTLGQAISAALFNMGESRWTLPWKTNDQIAADYPHLRGLQQINRATGRMGREANRVMERSVPIARKWAALPADAARRMEVSMLENTLDGMHVALKNEQGGYLSADQAFDHPSNKHLPREAREKFHGQHARFMALPASARKVYEAVRDDLTQQRQQVHTALHAQVLRSYADRVGATLTSEQVAKLVKATDIEADLPELATTPQKVRALKALRSALGDLDAEFGQVQGPYFPLVRFGDHVVVSKSQGVRDLEDRRTQLREQIELAQREADTSADDVVEAAAARVDELREQYRVLLKSIDALKQDPRAYRVEFYEKAYQAEQARKRLVAEMPGAAVQRTKREQYQRGLDGASPRFMGRLEEMLETSLAGAVSGDVRAQALQSLRDLYAQQTPERSAIRAELRRRNIQGAKAEEMARGYAQSARGNAWRISRLMHGDDVTSGLAALSDDRYSGVGVDVLNEMKKRFAGSLSAPRSNALLDGLTGTTYFMHLGFNASYFLTNATQGWMISLPVMGGRHGVQQSAKAMMDASRSVIAGLKEATAKQIEEDGVVKGIQLHLTDEQIAKMAGSPEEAQMLRELTDDGRIDITIKHDLGAITDGTGGWPSKLMDLSSAMANYPEMYNRLSTALAAYRLERARGATAEEATEYAGNIVDRTHFNYSPENAPRVMRSDLGRIVFQFKRYVQGMIYLFADLTGKAFHGDKEATRALAYLLGTHLAVAGTSGVPLAAPVGLVAAVVSSMFPDDDEPELMQMAYNGMKDAIGETAAQALVKGLPTLLGLDLSGKVGAGDLLNPVPFARTEGKKVFSSDWVKEVTFSLFGASMSLAAREADAVGYALEGKVREAAIAGLPTFTANGLRAWKQADVGVTSRRGDELVSPEEFGLGHVAAQALGFSSVKVSDMYDQRNAFANAVEGRRDARKALLGEYYEAMRTKDGEAMAVARQRIAEFNERQRTDPITAKNLQASMKNRQRQASETRGGLRVTPRDEYTLERLGG